MPDWKSIEEILRDADVLIKLVFVLFGLYLWELCTTFQFDLDVMLGRRPFRWPLVPFYFVTRYCMLMALIAVIVVLTIRTEIDCQAMISFVQWAANSAIAASSTCLMFRTIAIWERKRRVMIPLVVLSLAQWGLLYHGIVTVKADWMPILNVCNVSGTSAVFLNVMYFYTMAFDFVVLVLSTAGLLRSSTRSTLGHLLFHDGIVYFFSTFSANAVAAILNVVNLNPVMNIIATIPAAAISAIAATRAVVRLIQFRDEHANVVGATSFGGGLGGRIGAGRKEIASPRNRSTLAKFAGGASAISMESFTRDEIAVSVRVEQEISPADSDSPLSSPVKTNMDLEAGVVGRRP